MIMTTFCRKLFSHDSDNSNIVHSKEIFFAINFHKWTIVDIIFIYSIDVITKNNNEKGFLFELIDKINDIHIYKKYLLKLKNIVCKEENPIITELVTLSKLFDRYPTPNIFKQIILLEAVFWLQIIYMCYF